MSTRSVYSAAPAASTVTCPVCGQTVPAGEFCGACGAHWASTSARTAGRHHFFAADPAEPMLHLSVVSTLFPHLPHRHRLPFQLALIVTAALLLVLGLLRLTGPSIAVAALAVPLLYLVYLYEVEVYQDEPIPVIGATVVLGVLLGIPWALLTGPLVTRTLLQTVTAGHPSGRDFLVGVLPPLGAQLVMLIGPLLIYAVRRFDEALDGFAFGAAAALGFTFSTTLINLLPELHAGLISTMPLMTDVLNVVLRGLLVPFVNASLSGLLAGVLWLRRGRTRALPAHGWTISLGTAVVVVAVLRVGLGLVNVFVLSMAVAVIAYLAATIVLLLWVRVVIHHMLLAEAVEVTIGPEAPCSHCHHIVPRMAFCPHCGVATRATPKTGIGRTARTFR